MTSVFDPLVLIGQVGFPYWLIATIALPLLAGLIAKLIKGRSFLSAASAQLGPTFCFVFVTMAIYIQLTRHLWSFLEVFPSSLLVSISMPLSLLISVRSKHRIGVPGSFVTIAIFSVFFGLVLSLVITALPEALGWIPTLVA